MSAAKSSPIRLVAPHQAPVVALGWAGQIAAEAERLRDLGVEPAEAWARAAGVAPEPRTGPKPSRVEPPADLPAQPCLPLPLPRGPVPNALARLTPVVRPAVVAWLRDHPVSTASDIAAATGHSDKAVRRVLQKLEAAGVVREAGLRVLGPKNTAGHPHRLWSLVGNREGA